MMHSVMKRNPYLIDLVIELTDEEWERKNQDNESKIRKVF